ncbi:MAG: hypothetical protein KIT60_12025 [Burkholderiaceae bacterium]|nr:hypothetical protein [Burkholderiaceae bacterium]
MRPLATALLIGAALETVFASMFAAADFGPCGPNNPLGFIGYLTHLFPGIVVLESLGEGGRSSIAVAVSTIVTAQVLFWSVLAYAVLKLRSAKDSAGA